MTLGDPEEIKVIQAAFKMGYEEGRAQEREAVVEWLRHKLDDWPDYVAPSDIADVIEAGEHLE